MKKENEKAMNPTEEDITMRNHKDKVFRLLFNNEEKMLELYNAFYDTNYPLGTPVDINTIQVATGNETGTFRLFPGRR